jgi:hypothetical protein
MATTEYLASRAGVIGRYRAAAPLSRGDLAVARCGDGLHLAEVLRPATRGHAAHYPDVAGDLLRAATEDDLEQARLMARRASELLGRAGQVAASLVLPVVPLDAEVALDGRSASLAYLHWEGCDVRELVAPLSREFDLTLTLVDLTAPSGGGCGSCGGGGCGSGGCGTGCGSPSPEELQAYFAGLREQYQRRVPLL